MALSPLDQAFIDRACLRTLQQVRCACDPNPCTCTISLRALWGRFVDARELQAGSSCGDARKALQRLDRAGMIDLHPDGRVFVNPAGWAVWSAWADRLLPAVGRGIPDDD